MKALVFGLLVMMCLAGCIDNVSQAAPLPDKQRFTSAQRSVFADVARSVVGAYEALGRLDDRYDSEGICGGDLDRVGEEDLCTIWRFSSSNPTLRIELTRFVPAGQAGTAGRYQGWTHFIDPASQRPTRIDIRLDYDGDQLRVRLKSGVASS